MEYIPDQNDIVKTSFSPQKGHEQAGWRPAIVLSPKIFNNRTGFAWVCPITSHKKGYPFEVNLPDNGQITGVILTDQLKSLDWRARTFQYVERLDNETVEKVFKLIKMILF